MRARDGGPIGVTQRQELLKPNGGIGKTPRGQCGLQQNRGQGPLRPTQQKRHDVSWRPTAERIWGKDRGDVDTPHACL